MVILENVQLGWQPIARFGVRRIETLLPVAAPRFLRVLSALFGASLTFLTEALSKREISVTFLSEVNLINSLFKLLESLITSHFDTVSVLSEPQLSRAMDHLLLFSLVWSAGAIIGDERGRTSFDRFVRALLGANSEIAAKFPEELAVFVSRRVWCSLCLCV